MRLVRLAQQPSRVADDIRAALASLGRGSNIVGGVALIGVHAFGREPALDAVVVLPHGVLTVIGVDLPDPAMRLEAPLHSPWRADGWALVNPADALPPAEAASHPADVIPPAEAASHPAENATNPASAALTAADHVAAKIAEAHPWAETIGTIVAVGPFVDQVEQPPEDLAGTVRILHPNPTSMLAATVTLANSPRRLSVGEAQALLRTLAPDAPGLAHDLLLAEGFGATEEKWTPAPTQGRPMSPVPVPVPVPPPPAPPASITPTRPDTSGGSGAPTEIIAPITAPLRQDLAEPARPVAPPTAAVAKTANRRPPTVRWLPIAAVALLAVLLIVAIVLAGGSGGETAQSETPAPPPPSPSASGSSLTGPPPEPGVQFAPVGSSADQRCASHGFGDVQASLQRTSCDRVRRGSFTAKVDGRAAAVTVAVIEFSSAKLARDLKSVADTPGGGGVLDVASETGQWGGANPRFDDAAYTSSISGSSVRLVQAVWVPGPSKADDPGLKQAAKAALDLPLKG